MQLEDREINLKLTISLLLLAAFMLQLVACGGGTQIADTPSPEATVVVKVGVEPSLTKEPLKPELTKPPTVTEMAPAAIPTTLTTTTSTPMPTTPTPKPTVSGPGEPVVPTTDTSGANWNPLSAAENHRRNSPPDVEVITIDYDKVSGYAHVIASAGAVPAGAGVMVANLELGGVALVQADSRGAFETSVAARPGTHILIKQDATGKIIDAYLGTERIVNSETIQSPGVILSIPVPRTESGYGFAGAARVSDDGPVWVVEGGLSEIEFKHGDRATVAGKLTILTGAELPDGVSLNLSAQILGDDGGFQIGPVGEFLSNVLTPTGLPIELSATQNPLAIFKGCYEERDFDLEPLDWRQENGGLVADFSCEIRIDATAPAGTYVMWVTLENVSEEFEGMVALQTEKLLKPGRGRSGSIALATITVGSPAPLRLATTLFGDLLQEGTRGGMLAREDIGMWAVSPRTITQHNPIVPRLDSYGDPWLHHLDPYALLLGVTDRRPPAFPLIRFDLSSSELRIVVKRPDGNTDILGPAPFAAYGVKTPFSAAGDQLAAGGGHIGEIPQLLAQADVFGYKFPLDGDYVVELTGHVSDINGLSFAIAGTYDVTVANSLDIETLLLPGTPHEVGDSLPIGLQVYPGVPAEINFTVTYAGADNVIHKRDYAGAANSNGYWDGEGQFYVFDTAGEYRVDVEARYTGADGALWVGRMTYGSAVATPGGPIIAHGLRGPDDIDYVPPPWGFGSDFDSNGHLQFPFFTGDILWGSEGPDRIQFDGTMGAGPGDSVNLSLSFQAVDIEHPLVARALKQAEHRMGPVTVENISLLVQAGQVPLVTTVELNPDGSNEFFEGFRPEDFSLLAYTYSSAQRPGVRVREIIQSEDIGGAYWRFSDAYHMQSGNSPYAGDLPGDFKFLYGAAVIRDIELKEGVFAIYGSGWVLARDDDPMGSRFMPPFQGNAGGPNGGPLFNVHGRDVDIFFLPLGVRPGSVLEVGDVFRMSGSVMPTLPSKVEYIVNSPDGSTSTFEGRANAVGYFYDPVDDFKVDQPGLWTVELMVTHDGMTSAGPVQAPYPSGGPLTPDGQTFTFVVTDNDTQSLSLVTNLNRFSPKTWYGGIRQPRFEARLPQGWTGKTAHLTVTMPGIVLVEKDIPIEDGIISWSLEGEEMNRLANNFDYETGLADTITVTYYAEEESNQRAAGTILTHGARVPLAPTGKLVPASSEWPTGQTSCLPNEIELFSSDFESGTAGWDFSDETAWSVVQADGSNALRGAGHVHAYAGDNWDEVAWRMRVKLLTGATHLNFHDSGGLRYLISFSEDGTNITWSDVGMGANVHHQLNKWHVVEISLFEKVLRIAVDGVLEIEQPDSNPLPPGGIWLEVLPDSEVFFDDVHICEPSE